MKRALLIVLLAAVACKSPQDEAKAARETADSWAATGAMLASEWGRGTMESGPLPMACVIGAVTDAYARSTARVAREELASLHAPEQIRVWKALEEAVARHDRSSAPRLSKAFKQR